MSPLSLTLFAIFWLVVVYLFDSALSRKFKRIDLKLAILYFMTVALIGLYGEIFLDSIYNFVVGNPLWRYNILPIHHAYTSSFAIVVWGIYGFHLYLLKDTLKDWKITKTWQLVLIFALEALILEALLTISAKYMLGEYMYYYFPSDLWHVSSFQNIPFYIICSFIILKTIKRFKADPVFFSSMSGALLFVLVFLA